MNGQGMGEYCVDIVMCIDATGSMAPIIDEVKNNAKDTIYTKGSITGTTKTIENNLIENPHIISLLYGHISHYFLDINCHPLIYYIEFGCNQVGFIPPHDLIEGYLSSYLTEKITEVGI